jgi:hypothetical protein
MRLPRELGRLTFEMGERHPRIEHSHIYFIYVSRQRGFSAVSPRDRLPILVYEKASDTVRVIELIFKRAAAAPLPSGRPLSSLSPNEACSCARVFNRALLFSASVQG